jgi:hypothetical protein
VAAQAPDQAPGRAALGQAAPGQAALGSATEDRTSSRQGSRVLRLPVLAAVLGVLVVGGLVDRGSSTVRTVSGPEVLPMPTAAPAAAVSSTWFCAGATGQPAKVADGELVVANTLPRPLHGTATLTPSSGPTVATPFTVAARDRLVLSEAAAGHAPFVGAVVQLDGGGAAVEQVVTGAQGTSTAPCATTGSDRWYFADGTTQENASLYLTLLNPYSEDAIVDLSFTTEQGPESPADFQGLVVPAHALMGVDLGTHLRLRRQVATTVAARAGRVVAYKTQVIPPADQSQASAGSGATTPPGTPPGRPPGLSLVLGSPSPGTAWWWPQGSVVNGMTERYQIYNPGGTAASVSLSLALDGANAEPFALQVPPHGTVTVTSNTEARIPKGTGYAAQLRSTNGAGVVAERTVDAAPPSPQAGLVDIPGSRVTADQWLLAAGTADASADEWVIVSNPGTHQAVVSVSALRGGQVTPVSGLAALVVPAGGRIAVRINDHAQSLDAALLVRSPADVVVERDLDRAKGPGIDATMGVPVPS